MTVAIVLNTETANTVQVRFPDDWHSDPGNVADLVEQMLMDHYGITSVPDVIRRPHRYFNDYARSLAILDPSFALQPRMQDLHVLTITHTEINHDRK